MLGALIACIFSANTRQYSKDELFRQTSACGVLGEQKSAVEDPGTVETATITIVVPTDETRKNPMFSDHNFIKC